MLKLKMTKHGDYERRVRFDAWSNYEVHIVFTYDIAKSRKARYGTFGLSDGVGALHTQAEGGHAHLFFRISNCRTEMIAHECYHAIHCMFKKWAGVEEMDNETIAYHLGYLMQRTADFRNQLIDANIAPPDFYNKIAQRQAKVLSKIPLSKEASNGNQDEATQGIVARLQSLSTYRGGTSTEEGTSGPPCLPKTPPRGDNIGYGSQETSRV